MLIAHPRIQQNEIAVIFGYSAAWVSTVMSSDAFKSRLEQRRMELVDPEIRLKLEERFKALTHRSLQVLQEKLCQPALQVPDGLALKALELGAKCLGIGQQQTVVVQPPEDHLEQMAKRLVALQQQARGTTVEVDAEVVG
jgi:hypothetical protein